MREDAVAESFAQAQLLREAAQALSLMLAREADERGLATAAALSGPDLLRSWVGAAAAPVDDQADPDVHGESDRGGEGAGSTPGSIPGATPVEPGPWPTTGSAAAAVAGFEGAAASTLALLGAALREPRWETLAVRVASGRIAVEQAAMIVRFHRDLVRVADREHLDDVVASLVEHAPALTVRELRVLVAHARASMRPPADADAEERSLRAGRSLRRVGSCAGFVDFLLRLDPEGAAILEAAIDPLARPRPDLDWSELHSAAAASSGGRAFGSGADGSGHDSCPGAGGSGHESCPGAATSGPDGDPRTPATRRADALLELINRAVGAPEGTVRTPRTSLVVTMTLEALLEQLRGAGVAANGAVMGAATVRRLACEASIIPVVLGGPSEVLDVGREQRFFTPAQRRALAQRDGGCSYPGCTIPPQWCDAHHVVHWLHGGATDLSNGALLCGRHHIVVHERGLTATVTSFGVTWHS
ncbi:HNH endonuclease signature motif containing protein [Terrabacter lapilli]|uniref:HNH endonuclease signature motif containing protein n=1 Tax=Terrabacter lapilli TaxID=436231 RepID=UPI0031E25120